MKTCFQPADILLPESGIDMDKWAVIACDQYTSQPEYWRKVEDIVGGAPSTLKIVYPEAFLGDGRPRTDEICAAMREYLESNILTRCVSSGFVYVEREVLHGVRHGLVGAVDLEAYDFDPAAESLIRATEGTVISRIPPRVKIREKAPIECPHVMVLIDDRKRELIEPLAAAKKNFRKLYDFDLMLGGGHIAGYAVESSDASALMKRVTRMQAESGGFFIAAGDGNHSLATAKTYWESIKKNLTPEKFETCPARFALAELVNIHDESMRFEPVHRVLFNADMERARRGFLNFVGGRGWKATDGDEIIFTDGRGVRTGYSIEGRGDIIPTAIVQEFIDGYIKDDPAVTVDYIHGEESAEGLAAKENAVGILLKPLDKNSLFPATAAGGVLPRKTFSIGEADEKRFYLECRAIR